MVGGDFNEDHKPDLVVSTIDGGSQVTLVLLGNGDGTFAVQPPILNSNGFESAAVADINGDGHQDLVIGYNGGVAISLGKGDGTFADTVILPGTGIGTGYILGFLRLTSTVTARSTSWRQITTDMSSSMLGMGTARSRRRSQ